MTTTTTRPADVADVLCKTAIYVNHPVNASLSEALHTATRGDSDMVADAALALGTLLRRRVGELAWWDRSHTRAHVAGTLLDAAQITGIEKTAIGEHIIDWVQLDNPIDETPAVGTIHLPDGATVECVRVDDWANREDSEVARG